MTNDDIGRFWNVTGRTVKNWRKDGAPLDDAEKMRAWFDANPARITDGVRTRLAVMGGDVGEAAGGVAAKAVDGEPDADWKEFLATTHGQIDDDPKAAMAAVARARSFAAFKFDKASAANRRADMKFFADLLAKLESTLHDQQLRAKKLGIDAGELMPRGEFVRILHAWAYWTMRCVDSDLADLCPKMTGLAQANDARAVLEPALLSARILRPFARAARIDSPAALPEWVVDTMRDAVDDYIEDGAAEFGKEVQANTNDA